MVEPVHAGLSAKAEPPSGQFTPRVSNYAEHPALEFPAKQEAITCSKGWKTKF
jgi:hypothetical protein